MILVRCRWKKIAEYLGSYGARNKPKTKDFQSLRTGSLSYFLSFFKVYLIYFFKMSECYIFANIFGSSNVYFFA